MAAVWSWSPAPGTRSTDTGGSGPCASSGATRALSPNASGSLTDSHLCRMPAKETSNNSERYEQCGVLWLLLGVMGGCGHLGIEFQAPASDGGLIDGMGIVGPDHPDAATCVIGDSLHPTVQSGLDDPLCAVLEVPAGNWEENLVADRAVEIAGAGLAQTVLSGGHSGRVLDVQATADLVIHDLQITDGVAVVGAGIDAHGPVSLQDVRIHGNRAEGVTGAGAGLAVHGALVLVGAGVEIDLNAVDAGGAEQEVEATGAGVFLEGSGAQLRVLGLLKVHDNVATAIQAGRGAIARGGGIAVRDGARVDATDSEIELRDNKAFVIANGSGESLVSGGGLDCLGASVDLTNGDVVGNRSVFTGTAGAEATSMGGGLSLNDCSLTMNGTILRTNSATATGGQPELLATGGAVNAVATTISLRNLQISENIILFSHTSPGSVAAGGGAGVYLRRVTGSIENSTISSNVIDGTTDTVASVAVGAGLCLDTEVLGPSDVRISSSTISGNVADAKAGSLGGTLAIGGGVFLGSLHGVGPASLVLENTTISGNSLLSSSANVFNVGAGVGLNDADASRQLRVIHTTITDNDALGAGPQSEGGGIGTLGPASDTVVLQNSLVFGNRAGNSSVENCSARTASIRIRGKNFIGARAPDDCSVTFTPGASSLELTDPELGPLANNGGSSQTHAISSGSPARDTARNEDCVNAEGTSLAVDQRGQPRSNCDVGAFEVQ